MSSNIYNEGRVVGYSAYEVYVRHALSIDPNTQPASELEWLSSSIAMGTSMIVKINADAASGHHFQEIPLPANTRLAAANTIIGSLFLGDVALDSSGRWATKVTSYGPLIENNAEHPPVGSQDPQGWSVYPLAIHDDIDMSVYKNKLKEYIKVVDGIVIQPGSWKDSSSGVPPKDFYAPRLDGSPKVRILLSDNVSSSFYILLTGFTLGTVLKGVTGMDGSTDTSSPQDGDFLGPAVYPWANKIVFSVPPAYVRYYLNNKYSRVLGTSPLAVNQVPVIDMEATDPATYYGSNYTSNPINFTVTESNSVNGDAVLTVYQRSNILPPALYGTKVDATGSYKLCPIDTTAPGTVKIFEDTNRKAEAMAVNNIPGNIGMSRDANYILYQSTQNVGNQTMESDPVADTTVDELQQERTGGTGPLALTTTTGKKSNFAVSLVDTNGDELVRTGINIPFPSRNCYAENTDDNLMIPVEDKPSDWENGYMRNTYFQKVGTPFNGNGVTTTFTFPTAVAPDSILKVTVTINEVAYIQNDWSYNTSTKELTITPAPVNGSVIDAYDDFASEATFETINPIYDTSFPNSEPNLKRKGTLHWDDLMYALANNCAIDLFDNDYFLTRFAEVLANKLISTNGSGITIGTQGSGNNQQSTIATNIVKGSGINIVNSLTDSKKTIEVLTNTDKGMAMDATKGLYANIVAGAGIFVSSQTPTSSSPASTEVALLTNSAKGMAMDATKGLYANIVAGPGINVQKSNGQILVTNTAVDTSGYQSLVCGTDYTVTYFNGFQIVDSNGTAVSVSNIGPQVNYIAKSSDSNKAQIRISAKPSGNYYLGQASFEYDESLNQGFMFRHTKTTADRINRSKIFQITFTSSGKSKLGVSTGSIIDTSEITTGIWNILVTANAPAHSSIVIIDGKHYCGKSWPTVCRVEGSIDQGLVVYGLSYADGYNAQIDTNPTGIQQAKFLYSDHININVSGVV